MDVPLAPRVPLVSLSTRREVTTLLVALQMAATASPARRASLAMRKVLVLTLALTAMQAVGAPSLGSKTRTSAKRAMQASGAPPPAPPPSLTAISAQQASLLRLTAKAPARHLFAPPAHLAPGATLPAPSVPPSAMDAPMVLGAHLAVSPRSLFVSNARPAPTVLQSAKTMQVTALSARLVSSTSTRALMMKVIA